MSRYTSKSQVVRKPAVISKSGIVAAQNRLAAAQGAAALTRGGNAIDAAVTTAFALAATEPWMSGLGGGGSMVIYLAKEDRVRVIDFGMISPAALDPADFPLSGGVASDLFPWPAVVEDRNLLGAKSIAVPGAVDGLGKALEAYGTIGWRDAIQPAVASCRIWSVGRLVHVPGDRFFRRRHQSLSLFGGCLPGRWFPAIADVARCWPVAEPAVDWVGKHAETVGRKRSARTL